MFVNDSPSILGNWAEERLREEATILKPRGYLKLLHKRPNANGVMEVVDEREIFGRSVTQAFCNYVVDGLVASYPMGVFDWHDYGEGTRGERDEDSDLQTPTGESRTQGTRVENAANIFETVAEHTFTGTYSITEHGTFSASSGGTLMDRTVFTAIPVTNGESLTSTFRLTVPPGG
tara:strand:+ start:4383 stop:4910 length:528 start_codon:yes stop_codon:yes gene_type:complete